MTHLQLEMHAFKPQFELKNSLELVVVNDPHPPHKHMWRRDSSASGSGPARSSGPGRTARPQSQLLLLLLLLLQDPPARLSPAQLGSAALAPPLPHLREAPAGAEAVDLHLVEAGDLHGRGPARLFPGGAEAEGRLLPARGCFHPLTAAGACRWAGAGPAARARRRGRGQPGKGQGAAGSQQGAARVMAALAPSFLPPSVSSGRSRSLGKRALPAPVRVAKQLGCPQFPRAAVSHVQKATGQDAAGRRSPWRRQATGLRLSSLAGEPRLVTPRDHRPWGRPWCRSTVKSQRQELLWQAWWRGLIFLPCGKPSPLSVENNESGIWLISTLPANVKRPICIAL